MFNSQKVADTGNKIMSLMEAEGLSELDAVVCVTGLAELIYAQSPELQKVRAEVEEVSQKARAEFKNLSESLKAAAEADDTKQHVL